MTLGDNISISQIMHANAVKGDLSRSGEQIQSKEIDPKIASAARKADLQAAKGRFPQGYRTMLSREFDGIDLSGGQRVAIARGFYRVHDLIVLDEPTAAIDPLEETRIYEKFTEISEGKTAIIVTHRLGSAQIADRIIVMDQGRIIEEGSHEQLVQNDGKYAEMYHAQAQWYVREERA